MDIETSARVSGYVPALRVDDSPHQLTAFDSSCPKWEGKANNELYIKDEALDKFETFMQLERCSKRYVVGRLTQ